MNARTTMWEAVATAGRLAELAHWAVRSAVPALVAVDPAAQVQIYRSQDERLVIIATGSLRAPRILDAPEELCERAPHQWAFELMSAGLSVDEATQGLGA